MPRFSAGLLVYRRRAGLEVLLVHPGGPFWARKDEGAWSIPKGEYDPAAEDPLETAVREFGEELGLAPPDVDDAVPLGEVRQAGGKRVTAWAVEGDADVTEIVSNTFRTPWPPGSGRFGTFPEVDRAGWFSLDQARRKLLQGQVPFLDRLEAEVATA